MPAWSIFATSPTAPCCRVHFAELADASDACRLGAWPAALPQLQLKQLFFKQSPLSGTASAPAPVAAPLIPPPPDITTTATASSATTVHEDIAAAAAAIRRALACLAGETAAAEDAVRAAHAAVVAAADGRRDALLQEVKVRVL